MNEKKEVTQGGVEHRLYDGYDGGREVPQEHIDQLMAGAPPEIQARAKEWAAQQQKLGVQGGQAAPAGEAAKDAE